MKDKPKMQETMQDHAINKFAGEKSKGGIIMPGLKPVKSKKAEQVIMENTNFDELEADIKSYNSKILELDTDYKEFEPNTKVLIRAFHKEPVYSNGIMISPPVSFVPERGVQGAIMRTTQAPWAFARKAIVVSVPDNYDKYKPGDIVQVSGGAVACVKESQSEFSLPLAFTLYEWQEMNPPTSKNDKHYGYFLVDPYQHIYGKLNDNN